MAEAVLGDRCLVEAIQQYAGQKHNLPGTAKAYGKACAHCLQAPIAMLVGHDSICDYNIRTGRVVKRVKLKVTVQGNVPRKRHFAATFCGGFLYMFGGHGGSSNSMAEVAKFNIQECKWSWGAPMPTARIAAGTVTVGATIYVVGGTHVTLVPGEIEPLYDDLDVVEKYDTFENSWAPAPSLNRPRAYCSVLQVGSSIFVLGGCNSKSIERLDLNEPTAWEDFPTQMRSIFLQQFVSVALDRKIYVLGGNRKRCVLDLDSQAWAKLPRLPVGADHHYFSQGFALDGSIYLFGTGLTGGVSKYEPDTGRWLTLPRCKEGKEVCYVALLVAGPDRSSSIRPLQGDDQPLPLRVHQTGDASSSVIQHVTYADEVAAAVDPLEAAAVVAEQWAQQVALNLGASSSHFQAPGLLLRLILLTFSRHPIEFHAALLEGPELQSCREQMQGQLLPRQLGCGALVFLEPFQYNVAIEAATRQQVHLGAHHVITSQRFEPNVMQAVRGLRARLNVRVRSKQTILQPLEVQVVRTFLDVPDRLLRNMASVTHSTTDAHGGRNPRTFA